MFPHTKKMQKVKRGEFLYLCETLLENPVYNRIKIKRPYLELK